MFKFSAVSQIWKKYIQKLNDWDLPLRKTCLNNWSIPDKQVRKRVTEPGVRKGKRSLLVCQNRRKLSMETTRYAVKVKLGIKVMDSLIDWEVTGQGSECH